MYIYKSCAFGNKGKMCHVTKDLFDGCCLKVSSTSYLYTAGVRVV